MAPERKGIFGHQSQYAMILLIRGDAQMKKIFFTVGASGSPMKVIGRKSGVARQKRSQREVGKERVLFRAEL
jgi:hypothetical protein